MNAGPKPLSLTVGAVLAMVFAGLAVLGNLCFLGATALSGLTLELQDKTDQHNILLRQLADDIVTLQGDIDAGVAAPDAQDELAALKLREQDVSDHFELTKKTRRRVLSLSTWVLAAAGVPAMLLGVLLFVCGIKTLRGSEAHRRRAVMLSLAMCLLIAGYGLAQLLLVMPETTRMNEMLFDPNYMPQQMFIMDMKAATKLGNIFFGVVLFGALAMFVTVMGMLSHGAAARWCREQSQQSFG